MKRLLLIFLAACGSVQAQLDGSPPDSGKETSSNACGSVSGVKIESIQNANPLDPLGYPPYAADACQLAYVARDGTLILRDLARGTETVLADASENPRRPSVAGKIACWEATLGGKDVVRWANAGGVASTIPAAFARAGEPRAAADAIVLTGWLTADPNGDSDVVLFSTTDMSLTAIGAGPAQQRFPDIDGARVAWADFSEAGTNGAFEADMLPDGGYSPADIVVYDRAAKTSFTRKAPGKQAFPMLVAGGAVAYLDWSQVRPMPKLMEYGFKVGPALGDPLGDADVTPRIENAIPWVRPSVRGAFFEWLANGALWRRGVDLSTPTVEVQSFSSAWGTVSTDSMVIVAVGGSTDITLLGLDR